MQSKSKPEPGDLRERALRLLARREHSRLELTRKLEATGFQADIIQSILDEFEEKGWLSDRRFAESYVADHLARAGNIKLTYELRQRGVAEHIIESVLQDKQESELERARKVWQKKFGSVSANISQKAQQIRFMQSRGFSLDVIHRTIAWVDLSDR